MYLLTFITSPNLRKIQDENGLSLESAKSCWVLAEAAAEHTQEQALCSLLLAELARGISGHRELGQFKMGPTMQMFNPLSVYCIRPSVGSATITSAQNIWFLHSEHEMHIEKHLLLI